MSGNRISTAKIAVNNILHRRFRSACIALLITITTSLITGGTLLGFSLQNGVGSIHARLGADAMIVPQSAGDSFEGALLGGVPSTFYLTAGTANRILQMDGIERASPQLFISTFDSAHCAALVQIIGYEPETDFVVKPWLKGSKAAEPEDGEVVVGSNLQVAVGDRIQLFAVELDIVGALDKTGMGFDNSAFVNMETAKMLLNEYERFAGALPLPEGTDADGVVSALLLDFESGADITAFQRRVNQGFRDEGVRFVSSQALLQNTAKNLGLIGGILTVLLTAIWIFAVFVLSIIFTLALNERQREFGILRAIGATRRKLISIVLCEVSLLCGAGALAGVSAVCLIVFPYSTLIERVLQTAYLPPDSGAVAGLLIACLALGAAIGPLASLFSMARIGKNEALANLREGL
ncbi:MAG: ABC transporter permease [Clostridiales bacterium]|jgi:putative ABC transport system permease protein|nr:ABC transporter permease [Clostridiales bacterium]